MDAATAAFYRRLHEGLPPTRAVRETVAQPRKSGRSFLGWIEWIQYLKEVPGAQLKSAKRSVGVPYFHPFESHAGPELWRDGRGKLFVWGCAYTVTDRGIEDMPEGRFTRVCQDLRPRKLVTLGTLQWIRYRDNDGASRILKFENDARPLLCLSDSGKLLFVRGNYSIEEDITMARRRHQSRRHNAMRYNPSKGGGSKMGMAKKVGLAFLATGAGVFVGWQALSYVGTKLPNIANPYLKAATIAALGVGAGIAAYMYAPKSIAPTVGTALGAGGVALGINSVYAQYRARAAAGVFSLPAGRRAGMVGSAYGQRVSA